MACDFTVKVLLFCNIVFIVFFTILAAYTFWAVNDLIYTAKDYLSIKIRLTGINDYDKL